MHLNESQILDLAPDEASKKSGRDLASPAKWINTGMSNEALWGECQGSGSKPYQTAIDLGNIAFKCSCPSRKFPCKHGIALGLLASRNTGSFPATELPAWVQEWISKRAGKEEKKSEAKDKPVDEAARAKRQQAREQKVSDGIEELMLWLKDIVRNGILTIPAKDYQFWDAMSRRMIDAQAPGLASQVKALGYVNFQKEGWQSQFLDGLVQLYLLARAYQNSRSVDEILLQDIRTWIGFPVSQEELRTLPGITDDWLVVGRQLNEEDNFTIERSWLYGSATKSFALLLQFIARGQTPAYLLTPGLCVHAELVYYPSVAPLRATVRNLSGPTTGAPLFTLPSWKEVAEAETTISAAIPLRSPRPYAVSALTPVSVNNHWWLKDSAGNLMKITDDYRDLYKLLALSGGRPLDMVVLGKESSYEPLGVSIDQTYKPI